MTDLFDYATSPLSPVLKLVTVILFIAIASIYWDTRRKYGGSVRLFLDTIFLFAVFMATGSLFRYFGDGIEFGFTVEYSLKWFQSIAYCAGTVFLILAAKRLSSLFQEAQGG